MKFEEQFPSLINRELIINGNIIELKFKDGTLCNAFRGIEIQKHCIDKQKVKEDIDRLIKQIDLTPGVLRVPEVYARHKLAHDYLTELKEEWGLE